MPEEEHVPDNNPEVASVVFRSIDDFMAAFFPADLEASRSEGELPFIFGMHLARESFRALQLTGSPPN